MIYGKSSAPFGQAITRNELMSLTEECARITGIPYLMDAYRKEAVKILTS